MLRQRRRDATKDLKKVGMKTSKIRALWAEPPTTEAGMLAVKNRVKDAD